MKQARLDLSSAHILIDTNPVGAFMLTYDAARKALTAILANQGLSTSFSTSRAGFTRLKRTARGDIPVRSLAAGVSDKGHSQPDGSLIGERTRYGIQGVRRCLLAGRHTDETQGRGLNPRSKQT